MFLPQEKMEYFFPGSPIGKQQIEGDVKLFSESSQLSFVKIDISNKKKRVFKC